MSDPPPRTSPPPPPPPPPPVFPPPPPGRGIGWFFVVSGAVLLVLTLGCIVAVTDGKVFSDDGGLAFICGSPTLALGGVFLWLGSRRLKR